MKLSIYIAELSEDELATFAADAQSSVPYIKQLATGFRTAGVKSIFNIHKASNGKVTIADLRPEFAEHGLKQAKAS